MKKSLLSAFAVFAVLSANAQEVISTDPDYTFEFVPAIFGCNNESIILERHYYHDADEYRIKILTGNQAGTTFITKDLDGFDVYDIDSATVSDEINFTQNLFNEDEFIEWIDDDVLCSSNGTKAQLPCRLDGEIYKINGKYYLLGRSNGKYYLYLIDRKTASVKAVPADAPEARLVYSLSGRRQSEMQQGVNIVTGGENGPRKVLKR